MTRLAIQPLLSFQLAFMMYQEPDGLIQMLIDWVVTRSLYQESSKIRLQSLKAELVESWFGY
jgi:hypothetical protein